MNYEFLAERARQFARSNMCVCDSRSLNQMADAYVIEALAELAYLVGGIPGMNTVKRLGFEWKGGDG